MTNDIEESKKLLPEERIKKLKEIERKNQEEIKKAQDLIKKSEAEIEEEEESKKKIPIPQLRSVDVSSLFGKGTQEEQMFATKRFDSTKRKEEPELEEKLTPKQSDALEDKIQKERAKLREEAEQAAVYQSGMNRQQQQYQSNLAQELTGTPSREIYNAVRSAYEEARETGYVSAEQMKLVNAAAEAALTKMDAMVSGDYQQSKQATDALVASARMAKSMKDQYKR